MKIWKKNPTKLYHQVLKLLNNSSIHYLTHIVLTTHMDPKYYLD